jgi:Putative Ig domain
VRAALLAAGAGALVLTATAPAGRLSIGPPTCKPALRAGADVGSFVRFTTCFPYFAGRYTYLPASFRVTSGSLPPGLTLWGDDAPAAQITGTPTKAGTYRFRIAATDVRGGTASRLYAVTIHPRLVLPGGGLGDAYQGRFFSAALSASGGAPPYTYSADIGGGLSLGRTTGVLSGVVSAVFVCSFQIDVTDSTGATATGWYGVAGFDANGGGPYVVAGCPLIGPSVPNVRTIEPDAGVVPTAAGTGLVTLRPVVLTGGEFANVVEVTFAGKRAVFTIDSPTRITAFPPLGIRHGGIALRTATGLTRGGGVYRVRQSPTSTTTLSPRASQ